MQQQQHQGTSTFASEYEPSLFAQQQRGPCHHDWLWKVKCSPEVKGHKKLEQEGEIRPNDVIFNKLLGACEYLAFLLKALPA